jgi:hypothetical protein
MTPRVKPIPFIKPMVKALLDGCKTQTRRIIKLPTKGQYVHPKMGGWEATTVGGPGVHRRDGTPEPEKVAIWHQTTGYCLVTAYQPGGLLWVREAWRTEARFDDLPPRDIPPTALRSFEADYDEDPNDGCRGRYRQGMFMPRVFSRLTLRVTDVRIERVQEISEADAIAEGASQYSSAIGLHRNRPYDPALNGIYREGFSELWEQLNAKRGFGWDVNPWVAAITFDVIKANVDHLRDPCP